MLLATPHLPGVDHMSTDFIDEAGEVEDSDAEEVVHSLDVAEEMSLSGVAGGEELLSLICINSG